MNSEHFIKIMTVDDPHLIREGLAAVIGTQQDMELIAHASTGTEAIQQYHQHLPDVTLMNLRMPDLSGIDAVMAIRSEFPSARIIILTTFERDVEVQRVLEAGSFGHLLKSDPPMSSSRPSATSMPEESECSRNSPRE